MKKFEIWIGYYHLGQGYDPPREPELLATVESLDFGMACFKFELEQALNGVKKAEEQGVPLDKQSREWFYRPYDNSNSWTRKYYQTREEALETFN